MSQEPEPPLGEMRDCVRRAQTYLNEMPALIDDSDLSELRHHAGHVEQELRDLIRKLNEHRDRWHFWDDARRATQPSKGAK